MNEPDSTDLIAVSLDAKTLRRYLSSGRLVLHHLPNRDTAQAVPTDELAVYDLASRRRILERAVLETDLWLEFDSDECLHPMN